jgi:hypothetical protein
VQIEIPSEHYERLSRHATAAGFASVESFIVALADEPTADPRGVLTEDDLRQSAADCERGIAEIEAGGGQDLSHALHEIGRRRGYRPQQ